MRFFHHFSAGFALLGAGFAPSSAGFALPFWEKKRKIETVRKFSPSCPLKHAKEYPKIGSLIGNHGQFFSKMGNFCKNGQFLAPGNRQPYSFGA